jgi:hypothetical protein
MLYEAEGEAKARLDSIKARAGGDGRFAIAYAIILLTESLEHGCHEIASSINNLDHTLDKVGGEVQHRLGEIAEALPDGERDDG